MFKVALGASLLLSPLGFAAIAAAQRQEEILTAVQHALIHTASECTSYSARYRPTRT
jgi:hypothetical protein